MTDETQEFTNEWTASEPDWATVIRCPRCHALVDNDSATCRACGLEIKHKTHAIGKITVMARDPEFTPENEGDSVS